VRSSLAKAAPALAIVFSFLALCGPTGARADELLSNGGFEEGTAGWVSDTGTLGAVCEPALAVEGDCAGQLITDTRPSSIIQHELVPVQPGGSYTLSASILKNDPHVVSVELRITWHDGNGTHVELEPFAKLTQNSPSYQPLSVGTIESPAGSTWAAISIRLLSDSPGAEVYIDDVHFEGSPPAPTSTPYSPSPSATPTLAPLSTATPLPTSTRAPTSTPAAAPTSTAVPTPPGMATGYLLNGGFEEALDGMPVGWDKYGGALERTATHYRSGSFAAAYSSDTESTKWAYQPVGVQPDRAYVFDGYVLLDDPAVAEVFLRVSWYASDDASGTAIATSDSFERLSGSDPSFRYLTTGAMPVPEGARSAKVRVVVVPASAAAATIYLDDMSLYEAPPDMPVNPATPSVPGPEALAEEPAPEGPAPQAARFSEVLSQAALAERSPYQVKINEVLYDPAQPGDEAGNEWLELYNAGSEPVDLGDWTISDNGASNRLTPLTLPPGAFAVIAASEAFRSTYPAFDGSLLALDGGKIGNGLGDKGDRLILRDSAGRLADALSYGEDDTILTPPASAVASGHSLERSPPGHDTDSAADFMDNPQPSPGTGPRKAAVLSGAALMPFAVGDTGPDAESAQGTRSGGVGAQAWALIGAGLFALGAGLGVGAAFYRRRLPNKS
jgi:hypothetical protein